MEQYKMNADISLTFDENTLPIIEQIAEGMPGGFFIYHADGKEELIYFNRAMLRIFGCDTKEEFYELTGNSFRGIVHPDDLERVEESIARQVENSTYNLDYVEYRIIQKNGNLRWVEDYGHYLHTKMYGDVFYVFIEDATERMRQRMNDLERVNEELRNANARESQYKKAVLYDAVLFSEINLTKNMFITEALQMRDGRVDNPSDFPGMKSLDKYSDYVEAWLDIVDCGQKEEFKRFFEKARLIQCYEKGELEQTMDSWVTDVMGRRRLRHYVFLLGKNEVTGDIEALSIVKDITEQMEKQNLLKDALQQAETAKRARSVFLSNMSHDIRTPLNAIIGYTELIQNHIMEKDKVEEYNGKIRMSGEQLLSIVNESLEVTRMESGKVTLVEKECNLAELFTELEKEISPVMRAKTVDFTVDKTGVRHSAVIADEIRIKEILGQLLDNAVKYTNPGGKISLTVTEEDVDFAEYAKYRFVVQDDGIGISKEFMNNLFDPFKRENNTTQSGVLGTGLGLTVVKNMVDMMEGNIEVESEPRKGSRFTVSLLLKLQGEQNGDTEIIPEPLMDEDALKGRRILLVEDNEINLEIAEELLISQDYLVETAQDGDIALEMVANSQPGYYDLILMDIQMPVMNGHEATKAIRGLANKELSSIPIIALSANAFAEDYRQSIEVGMDAHFPKPIDINNLQEVIRTVLSNRRD